MLQRMGLRTTDNDPPVNFKQICFQFLDKLSEKWIRINDIPFLITDDNILELYNVTDVENIFIGLENDSEEYHIIITYILE